VGSLKITTAIDGFTGQWDYFEVISTPNNYITIINYFLRNRTLTRLLISKGAESK
jgi:hypothetical protein